MALYYVTGVGGTGKSTICRLLREKGYTAYDSDLDGLIGWREIESKTRIYDINRSDYLTPEWFDNHEWSIDRSKVEKIAAEAKDQTVFICGASSNDEDIHDLLDGVMYLTIGEADLRHRLATRDTNDFGKQPHEVDYVLRWLQPAEEYYRSFGALMLDATASMEEVLSQILEAAQSSVRAEV